MIKLKTGYKETEYAIIPNNEAHKAYYLFLNPEQRGVFSNGVAITGKMIMGIEPAFNESMGWNPAHKLDENDFDDIHRHGIDVHLRNVLAKAKKVAYAISGNPELMKLPLEEIETDKLSTLSAVAL